MQRLDQLDVDQDIRKAWTLPSWVYSDPHVLERVRERVFASSWQLGPDLDRVKVPGQVCPFTLLEGLLDEPLALTRDRADTLHCLSNVCTHRGNVVIENESVEQGLRCRYHGRRFGLDGRFQSMPEFEGAESFPSPADDLPRIVFEAWEKFVFVSLAPAGPLADWIGPMRERCQGMPLAHCTLDGSRSRDYLVMANWALYVDNYLEGFHIPFVHGGLSSALDYGSYRTELFGLSSVQVGVASGAEDVFDLPRSSPDYGQRIAAYYFWLFPNTMFNVYPWGVSVNVVRPLAVDRTKVSFMTYVWDPSRLDRGAGAALDRVEREDEVIVETVQRGVRSRLYRRGRYSPSREQGVHHFHRLLAEALRS
ncbi:MAG TPA: aromatic ring-hydroxylating dioxygenase subunit alpha [Candidatus Limnocylindria bacterium]|nr:aromatic ring-hydroxylating dioxygenase subunit alpha [Candidatus Limnocylindria bacterium]